MWWVLLGPQHKPTSVLDPVMGVHGTPHTGSPPHRFRHRPKSGRGMVWRARPVSGAAMAWRVQRCRCVRWCGREETRPAHLITVSGFGDGWHGGGGHLVVAQTSDWVYKYPPLTSSMHLLLRSKFLVLHPANPNGNKPQSMETTSWEPRIHRIIYCL